MNLDAVTRFAAAGILNSLLAGIAIAALAWVIARLFSRQGSGTRFAIWFLALIAIGSIPFVAHFASASTTAARVADSSAFTLPQSFATSLFVSWIIGATLGLLHVTHGLYRLRCLRATCVPVDLQHLDANSRATVADAQHYRHLTLCASDAVRVPAAIGYFRPMVVFPIWALSELPPAELNAILLHELAHLRRWDDFTNLAQKILKAIFFFHPAVWFIESRLTLEREMACDDAVLAASFSPRAYAESLVGLAEKSFLRRGVQLAQAAVSHVQQLKLRLAEILRQDKAGSQPRSVRVGKPAVVLMSFVGILSAYGIAHAPRLVAFSSDTPQLAAASTPMPHTILDQTDAQLQPVNLSYAAPAQRLSTPARKIQPAPVHLVRRAGFSCREAENSGNASTSRRQVSSFAGAAYQHTLQSRSDGDAFVASDASRWTARSIDAQAAERLTASPAPVLVVFQGQQFGPDGPIFWRVTIVHLTPAQQRAISGEIAKQI
jgi:beta-lactamase regulating signal transducer with metallopeptidase domain